MGKGRSSACCLHVLVHDGQSLADLVLTNAASHLCPATKTNIKLVQVDMDTPAHRGCPHQVDSMAFESRLEGASNQRIVKGSVSGAAS